MRQSHLVQATLYVLSATLSLAGGPSYTTRWWLDDLGSWSGGQSQVSVQHIVEGNHDGDFDPAVDVLTSTDHHETDATNEITSRVTGDAGGTDPAVRLGYDQAGNLVFDGQHFYRYDAFNRVVRIQAPGSVHVYPSGELTGSPGLFVRATFEYDALGRRVWTSASGADPTRHVYGSGAEVLTEYAVTSLGGGVLQEAFERDFVWGTGGFPDPVALVDFTGAGGGQAGLLRPFYYLKDALGSVGALTDANGDVVERYVYSPYGETSIHAPGGSTRSESLYGNPFAWTGQRYDAPNKLYHFWARTYSPELGRFLQEDEQGPLSPVGVSLFGGGAAPSVSPPSTSAGEEYVDGLNLFLYVGANPTNLRDPFGLREKDEYDEFMDDFNGHALYVIGVLNEGAKWASLGMNMALKLAWNFIPGSGVYDAFQSAVTIKDGKGGFWDAMNIAMSVTPIGSIGKSAGVISKAFKFARRGGHTAGMVGEAAEHLFKILPYKAAQKLTKGFEGKIQAHHLFEVRHARRLGLDTDEIPAVILSGKMHVQLTTEIQGKLRTGVQHSKEKIWEVYQQVYRDAGFPEWLDEIEAYFK